MLSVSDIKSSDKKSLFYAHPESMDCDRFLPSSVLVEFMDALSLHYSVTSLLLNSWGLQTQYLKLFQFKTWRWGREMKKNMV